MDNINTDRYSAGVLDNPQERRKRKNEEDEKIKKTMIALLISFYNGSFGDSFWPKKTVGRKKSFWR